MTPAGLLCPPAGSRAGAQPGASAREPCSPPGRGVLGAPAGPGCGEAAGRGQGGAPEPVLPEGLQPRDWPVSQHVCRQAAGTGRTRASASGLQGFWPVTSPRRHLLLHGGALRAPPSPGPRHAGCAGRPCLLPFPGPPQDRDLKLCRGDGGAAMGRQTPHLGWRCPVHDPHSFPRPPAASPAPSPGEAAGRGWEHGGWAGEAAGRGWKTAAGGRGG